MSNAVYQAAAGALIQQYRMDILSNNLANVNTVGFKEDRVSFKLLKTEPEELPGVDVNAMPYMAPVLSGDPSLEYYVNFGQGSLRQTGNPLDLAIEGDGFFNIETPDGVYYTRKGNFMIGENGLLITPEGYSVQGQSGDIQVEEGGTVTVDREGNIQVNGDTVDSFRVTRFANSRNLKKVGESLFMALDGGASALAADKFGMLQGYVELANVDPVRGMVEMVESLRVFEAYQKVLETADAVDSQAVGDVGVVA
jgi:flagellar basal-body rod protein FlgG